MKKKVLWTIYLFCSFFLTISMAQAQVAVWYVDAAQGVSGNGTSWFEAFKTIQEGVNAAYTLLFK